MENMCSDLFLSVNNVIQQALNSSLAMEDIKEVILMGGATRMPKVQEIIQKATGRLLFPLTIAHNCTKHTHVVSMYISLHNFLTIAPII